MLTRRGWAILGFMALIYFLADASSVQLLYLLFVVLLLVFILSQLSKAGAAERAAMSPEELQRVQMGELNAVTMTYVVVGLILLVTWILIAVTKMPQASETDKRVDFFGTFGRLIRNWHYMWGVVAQFFYVGAQIAEVFDVPVAVLVFGDDLAP